MFPSFIFSVFLDVKKPKTRKRVLRVSIKPLEKRQLERFSSRFLI